MKELLDKNEVRTNGKYYHEEFNIFKNDLSPTNKLVISGLEESVVLEVEKIIRCETNQNLTTLHYVDKTSYHIVKTLNYIESQLKDFGFVRIHQKHLINMNFIEKYCKSKTSWVKLTDKHELPISLGFKKSFISEFKKFAKHI